MILHSNPIVGPNGKCMFIISEATRGLERDSDPLLFTTRLFGKFFQNPSENVTKIGYGIAKKLSRSLKNCPNVQEFKLTLPTIILANDVPISPLVGSPKV